MKDTAKTILKGARQYGDELHIDLWYPDVPDSDVKQIVIGLIDVRAADDIRVSYDKQRDGWKIEQASTFEWNGDDEICDPDWQEVAFAQAWARARKKQITSNSIIQNLIDDEWEFSIRWVDGEFSICKWKPEWVTSNPFTARICPHGKGQTLEEAYKNLVICASSCQETS